MNKEQKEVQQAFLNNEKAVLKMLEENYNHALKDINDKLAKLLGRADSDMQHVIYQVEYQKALKTQIKAILEQLQTNEFETISQYLTQSYEDGFIGTLYDLQNQGIPLIFPIDQKQVVEAIQHETKLSTNLYTALGKDVNVLQKQIASEISRGISTNKTYADIAKGISNRAGISRNNAMRIARTEGHRIQNKATADAQFKAKEKGADVVKQWDSTLDSRTRKSHRKLDGQIRELEDPFTVGRHKAMRPGDFGIPGEDINCRCALLQRAKWALEDDVQVTKYTEYVSEKISDDGTTQYIDMSDAKNYQEFKKWYRECVRVSEQKIKNEVTELQEYTVNGITYKVDGKHVVLDNTEYEKNIAKRISKELDKNVSLVPRVVFPQGVSTPDYIIEEEKYDLKTPVGSGKNVLYNMIHKKKTQADNFVFDISNCPLDYEAIVKQIEDIYSSTHTLFVNEIIVVKDGKVKKKFNRKNKRN